MFCFRPRLQPGGSTIYKHPRPSRLTLAHGLCRDRQEEGQEGPEGPLCLCLALCLVREQLQGAREDLHEVLEDLEEGLLLRLLVELASEVLLVLEVLRGSSPKPSPRSPRRPRPHFVANTSRGPSSCDVLEGGPWPKFPQHCFRR